jgi:hypothetical protein
VHGPIIRIGNDKFGLRDARRHVVKAIKFWPSRAAAVVMAATTLRSLLSERFLGKRFWQRSWALDKVPPRAVIGWHRPV